MRIGLLTLLVAILLVGTVSAQYHDTKYLFGGYGTTSTNYAKGVWLADTANQTFVELTAGTSGWYTCYGITMDVDNTKVIALARGTTSTSYQMKESIYRVDPATTSVTTVFTDPNVIYGQTGPVHVNQDGDYVFMAYSRVMVSTATIYHYRLYKVPSLGGVATTLLNTASLGWPSTTTVYQGGQADINTGEYVVQLYNTSANVRYGLFNLSLDGSKLSTWSTGGAYGLYSSYYDGLCQDWDDGTWKNVYSGILYQLTPGTTNRTTLYNLGFPGHISMSYYAGKFDNRSAPNPRIMIGAYLYQRTPTIYYAPVVCAVDMTGPPYVVTGVVCDPNQTTAKQYNYPYSFGFYRGRHVQTLNVGRKQWQLRISCPRYPNKPYVAAISLAGYKPPVKLQDGRKIYLQPDSFTLLSINNVLRPFFWAGPGVLDAKGEAVGGLNFSALPSLDMPMWIAVAVLDPTAPGGIAYIPDTYVFRIP